MVPIGCPIAAGAILEIPQASQVGLLAGELAGHALEDLCLGPRHLPDADLGHLSLERRVVVLFSYGPAEAVERAVLQGGKAACIRARGGQGAVDIEAHAVFASDGR